MKWELSLLFQVKPLLVWWGLNALAKAGRFSKTAAQLGAAGVADAVVATNDTMTIGDFFDGGPTKTGDLVGLRGEEKSYRRFGKQTQSWF